MLRLMKNTVVCGALMFACQLAVAGTGAHTHLPIVHVQLKGDYSGIYQTCPAVSTTALSNLGKTTPNYLLSKITNGGASGFYYTLATQQTDYIRVSQSAEACHGDPSHNDRFWYCYYPSFNSGAGITVNVDKGYHITSVDAGGQVCDQSA